MDDPIKVLMKYKNNYRRTQYHLYVFVGGIDKAILKVLDRIKDLNFYDSLITLQPAEYKQLEKKYGSRWYAKLFVTDHIDSMRTTIMTTNAKKKIIEKYGNDWFNNHIENDIFAPRTRYSYNNMIKEEMEKKMPKKKIQIQDDGDDMDYRTTRIVTRAPPRNSVATSIFGGFSDTSDTEVDINSDDMTNSEYFDAIGLPYDKIHDMMQGGDINDVDDDGDIDVDVDADTDDIPDVSPFELDEIADADIEDIYREDEADDKKEILETSTMIKKALADEKIFKKVIKTMIPFDDSKDNIAHDEVPKNIFKKIYVTNQYIFKDDTIKTIKNKICCSIENNKKFGKATYIPPSRQYLWSEYELDGKIERIMVGQKWLRRNEILQVDIEPNSNFSVYEDLRGNLKALKDNIKRYGSKIKWENDEYSILYDYNDYFRNNEIFMVDLYNELGHMYSPSSTVLRNLIEVYMRVYFPKVSSDDIRHIMDQINGRQSVEVAHMQAIYDTINNDLVMENEIMNTVECVKLGSKHKSIFKDNYITQSTIHVTLRSKTTKKIDLFRIFNSFVVDSKYPFIQYQLLDGKIIYKYSTKDINNYQKKKKNIELLAKWFENSPYGISFKVRISGDSEENEKFMVIKLSDNSRIEYKIVWKEEDKATIEDIQGTYIHITRLIEKLNVENERLNIDIPTPQEYRFAFINTIQKFELPGTHKIDHNDLSDFARFFFPYVSLVIEPRKRQSKFKDNSESSKFGTYLRYKRVSKYENHARIEQRILYFMRNYEYNDKSLSSEIGKQFNITDEKAMEEIDRVRNKYPNLKKSRKVLKKLENIPKYKPPGIGIDIQGKHKDNYKIRISGARNKEQLDRMISFMNILIFLYFETYLEKKKDRQYLKEKLKKLVNVAKRRNRVVDFVDYETTINTVKQMAQIDKKRIGYTPGKGQSQWTRACQNSGDDKKRRPQQYTTSSLKDLIKKGYKFNKSTGMYEKEITVTENGKKKKTIIRAVRLPDIDNDGDSNLDIYYACSPDENGEHMYVGFLSKSSNPFGYCMPCCFKKDPLTSKNKEKRDYFKKCMMAKSSNKSDETKVIGDKLYILQDTNKIQVGRFGFLPKYLDYFFNFQLGNTKKIKHHYLLSTKPGYFFKYGTRQDEYPFLNAIATSLDMTIADIKSKMIAGLTNDKGNRIFTYLNNGDIRSAFKTRETLSSFINDSTNITSDIAYDLISLPGILNKFGVNIFIIKKVVDVVKDNMDRERTKEDFIILCKNSDLQRSMRDNNRVNIILLQEENSYYPITYVRKTDESSKDIDIISMYKYNDDKNNIMEHIANFFLKSCQIENIEDINSKGSIVTARDTINILEHVKDKNFMPKTQIVDIGNKCVYVVLQNNLIIPTKPSGIDYRYSITSNIDTYIQSMDKTIELAKKLYTLSNRQLALFPIGVYYDVKKNNMVNVSAVLTKTYSVIPVQQSMVLISDLEEAGYTLDNEPVFDKVDKALLDKSKTKPDERELRVRERAYMDEAYNLFRYEISEFLAKDDNHHLRTKLVKAIANMKITKRERVDNIRMIIYKLIDRELYDLYDKMSNKIQSGGAGKFVHITNNAPDTKDYEVNNVRASCSIHASKDQCMSNMHCYWSHNNCFFRLTRKMAVIMVNKVSEELADAGLKMMELMRVDTYYVSDIVDYNVFTERPNQKIIKSTNTNINKLLEDLFGSDNVPTIGKKRTYRTAGSIDYKHLNIDNPIKDMGSYYVQNIMENNLSVFRAFVNGFYWFKHEFYDASDRNLGYYSETQTDLATYFRSIVIDWLTDIDNYEEISDKLLKYLDGKKTRERMDAYIITLGSRVNTHTNGVIELYVMNRVHKIPIIVVDNNNDTRYVFDNGIVFDHTRDKDDKKYKNESFKKKSIILIYNYISNNHVPDTIDVLYNK